MHLISKTFLSKAGLVALGVCVGAAGMYAWQARPGKAEGRAACPASSATCTTARTRTICRSSESTICTDPDLDPISFGAARVGEHSSAASSRQRRRRLG